MRETGILMAVSSLPSPYGAGDFGRCARDWIDLLCQNGVTLWQILPLNPTGYGNSPYQPYSSFAGDEIYLSLERLAEQGLLDAAPAPFRARESRVDYEAIREWKEPLLREACARFVPNAEYEEFAKQGWAADYAVFRAFKKANDRRCWLEWPDWQRDWPLHRDADLGEYEDEIRYHLFLQYQFSRQWAAVRDYAHEKGVRILGDVPFYVGIDSVDVWAGRENFLLDSDGRPTFIAGVPPDYFSATGQRWGNPIYDWDKLRADDFEFWVRRIGYNQTLFDIIRIDHFRAFDTYWKIAASCPTAIDGQWIEAPGYAVLDTLYRRLPGLALVAEDLGDLRPEVLQLRDHYRLKGMKVLEFTLNAEGREVYDALPDRENQILYTGTHDNATLREWYSALPAVQRRRLCRWLAGRGFDQGTAVQRIVALALASPAQWVVIPVQDAMQLPAAARMNTPGTVGSPNWEWRLPELGKAAKALERLRPLIRARKENP